MNVSYTFDSLNFKTYGVYVSKSSGWFGQPPRKEPEIFEFPEETGYVPDLKNVAYKAREITLECFIKSTTLALLVSNYNTFTTSIQGKTETRTLTIAVTGLSSVSYMCYVKSLSDLQTKLINGANVGTFTIVFVEPQLPEPEA